MLYATVDISLYPFDSEFETLIGSFIEKLKLNAPDIQVNESPLSTQLAGPWDSVMHFINTEMKDFLESHDAIFVIKVTGGLRIPESD